MKKFLLFSVSFLTCAFIVCNAQQQKRKANSLLWKITGNNLKQPSFLFGTVHMICPDQFLWTSAMKKSLNASRQVAFEMDLDDPSLLMQVSAGLMLPDSMELKDFFTPNEYSRLLKYAEDTLKISGFMLSKMQPFAILTMAMETNNNCKGEQPVSYEQKIMGWAKEDHKEIVGLESAQDQLAVISKMNKDSTAEQILRFLNEPKETGKQYQQLISAYTHQDLNKLHKIILSSPDMKADLPTLLYNRNKKWIPEIEKMIKEKSTFIAVGAGHLGGEGGVIQLLQQAGYKVEPVF